MPLSRADETELLVPLYEGVWEEPRWRTFLQRLRRRTRADFAGLRLTPDAGEGAAVELAAGLDRWDAVRTLLGEDGGPRPGASRQPRPGRAYGEGDLDPLPEKGSDRSPGDARPHLRLVRTHRVEGLAATLLVARENTDFGAADGALLTALAVHLEAALLGLGRSLGQQRRSDLAVEALAAAGVAWIALDGEARIVDFDPHAREPLLAATGRAPARGERLQPPLGDGARALATACAAFGEDPEAPPRLARLSEHPSLDLLLRPAPQRPDAALAPAVALGLLRVAGSLGNGRADLLTELLGLSPSEARLALAMADGRSIVEAGAALGLTPETARNYSKRLYAKTHTAGQAALVALVRASVAMLA